MKFKVGDIIKPLPSSVGNYGITNSDYVSKMRVIEVYTDGFFNAEIIENTIVAARGEDPDFAIGTIYRELDPEFFQIASRVRLLSSKRIK